MRGYVDLMSFLLLLVHLGVAVAWLGSMGYSLVVVQPGEFAGPFRTRSGPRLYRELAAGNRWPVIGLIGVLALSGAGLTFIHDGRSYGWWLAVGLKVLLLVAASALFWWVSWRGWPRRFFALPEELPAEQARFRRVAVAMAVLVGLAFLAGVAMGHL